MGLGSLLWGWSHSGGPTHHPEAWDGRVPLMWPPARSAPPPLFVGGSTPVYPLPSLITPPAPIKVMGPPVPPQPSPGTELLVRARMGPSALLGLCLLGCLFLTAPLPVAQDPGCPRGWLQWGGHCYGYFGQELSWRQAEARCRALRGGGHLASLQTPAEHRALAAFAARHRGEEEEEGERERERERESVWIGLHRRGPAWLWSDGSPWRYWSWGGDDAPAGRRCVALEKTGAFVSWEEDSCGERKPFVCKMRA
ncbi:struthiocalcin-1-like isoform X2 [Heliangelus exortis]|uniref:struthiocalcin-1-like isoform X2 n=1 Tax=Heliangelus exortis TaxID=472823 RepID=UPI003A8D5492